LEPAEGAASTIAAVAQRRLLRGIVPIVNDGWPTSGAQRPAIARRPAGCPGGQMARLLHVRMPCGLPPFAT
jgi:hypothetical protein